MLKVIGASWLQTKISSGILLAMLCLAIWALFIGEVPRSPSDGTYSATVFWNHKTGFRVEMWGQGNDLMEIPQGAARAAYRADNSLTGWALLEIQSNQYTPDWVQAYSAGLLEGALSWQAITWHWNNVVQAYCGQEEFQNKCDELRETVMNNAEEVKATAKLRNDEPFWHQVGLFYHQLDGLEYGYRNGVRRSRNSYEIPTADFLLLNMPWLLQKHLIKNNKSSNVQGHSKVFVKLLTGEENDSILLGHSTVAPYNSMIRILKRYYLGYHMSGDSTGPLVPGVSIVFSSHPAALSSLENFYQVSGKASNLLVAGTCLHEECENFNAQSARIMAANRLSHSGKFWTKYFLKRSVPLLHSTGSQWAVTDLTKLKHLEADGAENLHESESANEIIASTEVANNDGQALPQALPDLSDFDRIVFQHAHLQKFNHDSQKDSKNNKSSSNIDTNEVSLNNVSKREVHNHRGLLWLVETSPGLSRAGDITRILRRDKYWASGSPYSQEIRSLIGSTYLDSKWWSAVQDTANSARDLQGLSTLFHKTATRGDLYVNEPDNWGNVDMKLVSGNYCGITEFQAQAGPLFSQHAQNKKMEITTPNPIQDATQHVENEKSEHPEEATLNTNNKSKPKSPHHLPHSIRQPFRWSKSTFYTEIHNGQPDLWNFGSIVPRWAWLQPVQAT